VPAGTARVRISITLNISTGDIADLAHSLKNAVHRAKAA